MGKLKDNLYAFPELQTKFFPKQWHIWSFPESFNEFHHKLPIFKSFRYNTIAINNEEKSYNNRYLPLSSSKYNKTSPKLVYSQGTSGTVMHEKIQPISMQNAKVMNQDR